jgi:hypothetical protein
MGEFRFTIKAYTKDTIPFDVLVRYLADLVGVLGTPHAVHLDRLEDGSVVPVVKVEKEAVPKVRERVRRLGEGVGPAEALRAYSAINDRLRQDNGTGAVIDVAAGGAEIIQFPGSGISEHGYGVVRRQGTLDGEVIRVGGKDRAKVRIMLQSQDRVVGYIHAKKTLAKELGNYLYEPVRLYGSGRWRRDSIGAWTMEDFRVDRFELLKADKLSTALTKLRSIAGGEWSAESYEELRGLRGDDEDDDYGGDRRHTVASLAAPRRGRTERSVYWTTGREFQRTVGLLD